MRRPTATRPADAGAAEAAEARPPTGRLSAAAAAAAAARQRLVLPRRLVLLLLALLSAAAAAPRPASAHAVLIDPPSRPWLDYLLNYNYNPHAVFAGGTMAVSKNETLVWPASSRSGICGDALNEAKWDAPAPTARKTYRWGDAIDVDVLFAQNHLGRWRVRLCPLDARDEGACADLRRADGLGRAVDLVWTRDWHGVTSGFEPPLGVEGFSIYKLPPIGKAEGCGTWACDQFKGMYVYRSKWRLPSGAKEAGFACGGGGQGGGGGGGNAAAGPHCKLQMEYLTASRCWPPCLPDSKGCKPKPVNYPYCGTPGASYPETFWNCADVAVVG